MAMRLCAVATSVAVTEAPGTGAPAWSVTVPVISAPAICARDRAGTTSSAAAIASIQAVRFTIEVDCTSHEIVNQFDSNRPETIRLRSESHQLEIPHRA